MAIQKSKTILNGPAAGETGNYWRIGNVYVSPNNYSTRAEMRLYASAAAYLSGAAPIDSMDYDLSAEANPLGLPQVISLTEEALIANIPDFSGGIQVN